MVDQDRLPAEPSSEGGCHALGALARNAVSGELSGEAHIGARARFVDELDARRGGARRGVSSGWLGLLQAAVVTFAICFGGLFAWSTLSQRRLTYVVEGENHGTGAYVRSTDSAVRVVFSEGSELRFEPGGSGELAELTPRGARIVAHDGMLDAHIQKRPDAGWSFEAGPYSVNVTGTEFSLSWNAADRKLVIELEEGSLLVRGPQSPGGVALVAGRRLVGREGADALSITELRDPAPEANASRSSASAAPSVERAGAAAQATTCSTSSGAPEEARSSWPELVAAGRFADVVADAESTGIDAVLEGRSLADLLALADAARYAKRSDLAERVLLAERTRFPASAQATTAGFLLGRLAEARGSAGEALQWYSRYRAEAPSGALAEEALGRLMVLLANGGQPEGARSAAREYLASYPSGASAKAAKALLGEP